MSQVRSKLLPLIPTLARMELVDFAVEGCDSGELPFEALTFEQKDVHDRVSFDSETISSAEILERFSLDPGDEEVQREFVFEVVNSCPEHWPVSALQWRLRHQFPEKKIFHCALKDINTAHELKELVLSFCGFRQWGERLPCVMQMITLSPSATSFDDLVSYLEQQGLSESECQDLLIEFANKSYESARQETQGGSPPRAVFLPLAYALVESLPEQLSRRVLDIPIRQLIVWKIQKFLRGHHELLESTTHGQFAGLNNLLPMVSAEWLHDVLPEILEEESINALARGRSGRVLYLLMSLRGHVNDEAVPSIEALTQHAAEKAESHLGRFDIAAELRYVLKQTDEYDRLIALADLYGQNQKLEIEYCAMA